MRNCSREGVIGRALSKILFLDCSPLVPGDVASGKETAHLYSMQVPESALSPGGFFVWYPKPSQSCW